MQIDAMHGTLRVRMGATFGAPDVARLQETVAAFGPFSHLTIEFAAVRQCDEAALAQLAGALASLASGEVTICGLTLRQRRLLTHLGVDLDRRGVLSS